MNGLPEGLTVWSTLERWLRDGVLLGFVTKDVADSVLAMSQDGRDRIIVEVGMRVRPSDWSRAYSEAIAAGADPVNATIAAMAARRYEFEDEPAPE